MKFDHRVNFNGAYYNAGEDVPIKSDPVAEVKSEPTPEPNVDEAPKRRGRQPKR